MEVHILQVKPFEDIVILVLVLVVDSSDATPMLCGRGFYPFKKKKLSNEQGLLKSHSFKKEREEKRCTG